MSSSLPCIFSFLAKCHFLSNRIWPQSLRTVFPYEEGGKFNTLWTDVLIMRLFNQSHGPSTSPVKFIGTWPHREELPDMFSVIFVLLWCWVSKELILVYLFFYFLNSGWEILHCDDVCILIFTSACPLLFEYGEYEILDKRSRLMIGKFGWNLGRTPAALRVFLVPDALQAATKSLQIRSY
jgi:hypothetical protein